MTDDRRHERFSIPHDPDLFSDTWADDLACPNCGQPLKAGAAACPKCHQWIGDCGRSCPGCPSPTCVGGKRTASERNTPR